MTRIARKKSGLTEFALAALGIGLGLWLVLKVVRTGVPGVVWLKLIPQAPWPKELTNKPTDCPLAIPAS